MAAACLDEREPMQPVEIEFFKPERRRYRSVLHRRGGLVVALGGGWPRVKACRNEPCHRAFIDHSRNTSAAYWRTRCSSQSPMRAYRARRRAVRLYADDDGTE